MISNLMVIRGVQYWKGPVGPFFTVYLWGVKSPGGVDDLPKIREGGVVALVEGLVHNTISANGELLSAEELN
jgi:hypothetical protein